MPEVHKIFIISRWWPGAKRLLSLSLEPFRRGYLREEERGQLLVGNPPFFMCPPKAPVAPGHSELGLHTCPLPGLGLTQVPKLLFLGLFCFILFSLVSPGCFQGKVAWCSCWIHQDTCHDQDWGLNTSGVVWVCVCVCPCTCVGAFGDKGRPWVPLFRSCPSFF